MGPGLTRRMLLNELPRFQRQYPDIQIVLLAVDNPEQVANNSVDVLMRGRSLRRRGGRHREPQGLVVRTLTQPQFVICASPTYLERHGVPRTPDELSQHACIAHLTLELDIQDEWQFEQAGRRQRIRFDPQLLVQGTNSLREAALAGCGLIRLNRYHIEDELRQRSLKLVLSEWSCVGAPPIVAIYKKTVPPAAQITVFVRFLVQAFLPYRPK